MAEPVRIIPTSPAEPVTLPANLEAEAALLGAMMIDNRIAEDVQVRLRSEHFHDPLHGRIYDAILRLADKNMIANPVTLRPMFDADEAMRALGGPAYLVQLTSSGSGLIGARDFAGQIYELALLRALIGVGREMVEKAIDTSEAVDPKTQIEEAEVALYRVAEEGGEQGSVKSFVQAARAAVQQAERALNSGGHLSGITTGFDSLNGKIGGLHRSDLLILAGRPGMGKTALATNIAFNIAKAYQFEVKPDGTHAATNGGVIGFFSLEMSSEQLATRIIAEQSGVASYKIRRGDITDDDFHHITDAARQIQTIPFYIDHTGGISIAQLTARARRLKRQRGLDVLIVDYLQLLSGSKNANANRVQELTEITTGLKALAKELSVPVVALSQLSRQVESRDDKRPQLSDLRESGSIEQDADVVIFVYREEYYLKNKQPREGTEEFTTWLTDIERAHGKAEVIIGKQRHGPTGTVELQFDAEVTRFSDLASEDHLPAHV